jgi:cytokinin dehydrogenase
MTQPLSRRRFMAGMAAAFSVAGFDPVRRSWLTEADASTCGGAIQIPHLDGELVVDGPAITEAGTDFGSIISKLPRAVLRPGSAQDIQRVITFANTHRLSVAMRGQAHSVFGQAQADCGIVIDSRTLNQIHSIDEHRAVVDAGVTWRALVTATLAQGRSPRVLADYLDLSVGGLLSVGGIGGHTQHFGLAADNCLALTVVTGEGKLVTCSAAHRADLFHSVLGGLGQFAIIVKASIPLVPAQPMARIYQLAYLDLATYLADQRLLLGEGRFDFLEGQVVAGPTGNWMYVIEAGAYFTSPNAPDDGALIGDLHALPGPTITDMPYFAWLDRITPIKQMLQSLGLWEGAPHPWSDLFLPDSGVERYVSEALAARSPEAVGLAVILLYPFRRDRLRRPFIMVPHEPTLWLFDILRFPPRDPAVVDAALADNRALYEEARRIGGKRYPISAVPFSQFDWIQHYELRWFRFLIRKARYDPRRVLTPGQGILST